MIFRDTDLPGVHVVELEPHLDERGFFARTFCAEEFSRQGLNTCWPQCNLSHSNLAGTLRGLHYQAEPEPDAKLIRVVRGGIFAAVADIRPGSPTCGRTFHRNFSDCDPGMLYVPAGCAVGFQTLADDTELFYQMSVSFRPDLARGIRWDDPSLDIPWPRRPTVISARDRGLPLLGDVLPVRA